MLVAEKIGIFSEKAKHLRLDDVVITNLVEWGFSHKEVKLLLMIKHGRLT